MTVSWLWAKKQERYSVLAYITQCISLFVQLFQWIQYVQLIIHHVSSTCWGNLFLLLAHIKHESFSSWLTNGVMEKPYHIPYTQMNHLWQSICHVSPWNMFQSSCCNELCMSNLVYGIYMWCRAKKACCMFSYTAPATYIVTPEPKSTKIQIPLHLQTFTSTVFYKMICNTFIDILCSYMANSIPSQHSISQTWLLLMYHKAYGSTCYGNIAINKY